MQVNIKQGQGLSQLQLTSCVSLWLSALWAQLENNGEVALLMALKAVSPTLKVYRKVGVAVRGELESSVI